MVSKVMPASFRSLKQPLRLTPGLFALSSSDLTKSAYHLFGTIRYTHSTSSLDASVQAFKERSGELRWQIARIEAMERYERWTHSELVARIQDLEAAQAAGQAKGQKANNKAMRKQQSRLESHDKSTHDVAFSSRQTWLSDTEGCQQPRQVDEKPKKKEQRTFDVSALPTRKIALRFAYDGANYSGLAFQGDGIADSIASSNATNILPTVEALLWNALCTARLVDPTKGKSGAGWSRCGRTDRGVSAAGQVVALWVRSCKVDERHLRQQEDERLAERERSGQMRWLRGDDDVEDESKVDVMDPISESQDSKGRQGDDLEWSYSSTNQLQAGVAPDAEELPYVVSLNRLLPSTIRILGWSPVRADFNARFDCRYRHYKYFFTSGPPDEILAPPQHVEERHHAAARMDIQAMREAASYLLGEHDFRNLCKVDPSKQIKNFRRRIDGVSIDKVQPGWPTLDASDKRREVDEIETEPEAEEMYVLNLRGTAFLYHQVRHIMAVLLLVGARMEKPSIVQELLNIKSGAYQADLDWLKQAGVDRIGETALPISTATELDGATAMTASPITKVVPKGIDKGTHAGERLDDALARTASRLAIYGTKPEYELSADRPLMLWECGFRPRDIQWRTGSYDGPINDVTLDDSKVQHNLVKAASIVSSNLYQICVKTAIDAEIARHFFLAASPASTGVTSCGTLYRDSRWPFLTVPSSVVEAPKLPPGAAHSPFPLNLPFGHGNYRPVRVWNGLASRKREDSVEIKNERWLLGKGKRRADRKGTTAERLPTNGRNLLGP